MAERHDAAGDTRRVEFWISADVPAKFDDAKLTEFAARLAQTATQLVAPGKSIEHGYEFVGHEDGAEAGGNHNAHHHHP